MGFQVSVCQYILKSRFTTFHPFKPFTTKKFQSAEIALRALIPRFLKPTN